MGLRVLDRVTEPPQEPRWRGALASVGAVASAALATQVDLRGFKTTLAIPTVLLAASAIAIHVRRLEAQVLTRALWFSTALVAAVHLIMPLGVDAPLALAILVASGGALAAAGTSGLRGDAAAGAFRPVAFRASLLASVGMALADALALLFYGIALFERFDVVSLSLFLGPLLCVAAIGVYRLKTSAVFAMLLLNAIVLGAAVAGALWVPPPLATALVVTSLIQLLLPLPMLRAIIRRPAAAPNAPRVRFAEVAGAEEVPPRIEHASWIDETEEADDAAPQGRSISMRYAGASSTTFSTKA